MTEEQQDEHLLLEDHDLLFQGAFRDGHEMANLEDYLNLSPIGPLGHFFSGDHFHFSD